MELFGPRGLARRVGLRSIVEGIRQQGLSAQVAKGPLPRHVGVLVDGNRRWARQSGLGDLNDGHRAGARKVEEVVGWCDRVGVEVVTFYLLSTDNLHRPAAQLDPLLDIIADLAMRLSAPRNNWRLRIFGHLELLPGPIAAALRTASSATVGRAGRVQINLLNSYDGRQEITEAVRAMLAKRSAVNTALSELVDKLVSDDIAEHLYTAGQPDPDLAFRTSGEQRLSGFLPWQSVYSELYFPEVNWPDLRYIDFLRALRTYARRQRRFGS